MACELWEYDTTCLPSGWAPAPGDLTPAQRSAYDFAVELLGAATLGQFGVCELVARPCTRACAHQLGYSALAGGWFAPYLLDGQVYNGCGCVSPAGCGCGDAAIVRLAGPVAEVVEVKVDGAVLDPSAWYLQGRALARLDGGRWPLRQDVYAPDTEPGTFSVRYRQGVELPVGGRRALSVLMVELHKARCGDGTCRLPQRVTSIVREGVTYQMLDDPSGLLDAGRTGIADVDMWLASINPTRARTRMRVYSPDVRPQTTRATP
jgi:hypothetical protein